MKNEEVLKGVEFILTMFGLMVGVFVVIVKWLDNKAINKKDLKEVKEAVIKLGGHIQTLQENDKINKEDIKDLQDDYRRLVDVLINKQNI